MATYQVKQGDTLGALAKQFGTDVNTLAKNNKITNPDVISVGQSLELPSVTPTPSTAPTPASIPDALTPDELLGQKPVQTSVPQTPDNTNDFLNSFAPTQQAITDFLTQSRQSLEPVKQERTTLQDRLEGALGRLTGRGTRQQELEANLGVNDNIKRLSELNTQMAERGAQFQKEIAQLPGQGRGITNAVVNAQTDRARRIAAVELGGLASIASALQGNIALAQDQAKRAVDYEFAPVEQEISNLERLLEINKENFTEEESKRAEQLKLTLESRKDRLEEEKQNKRSILGLAQEVAANGGDNLTIQKVLRSKTQEEALNYAGAALGQGFKQKMEQQAFENKLATEKFDFDKKITTAKLNLEQAQEARLTRQAQQDLSSGVLNESELKAVDASPQGKKLLSLNNLLPKVIRYKALVDQYGFQLTGPEKTELEGAYSDLQISWKEAANLGALTGPDLALIENAVKPVTGVAGIKTKYGGGGLEGVQNGLQSMINTIKTDAATAAAQLNTRNSKYENSEYVKGLTAPFAQVTTSNNAGRVVNVNGKKYKVGLDGDSLTEIK